MQRALASRADVPAFAPESIANTDAIAWTGRLLDRCDHTFDLLKARRSEFPELTRVTTELMLSQSAEIKSYIQPITSGSHRCQKIRHHGDFHLGQVLIVKDDAFILDFEGEPRRSLDERRQKAPAARDIAGLIRSIDYSTTSALLRATMLTAEERTALTPSLATWRDALPRHFGRRAGKPPATAYGPAMTTLRYGCWIFSCLKKHSTKSSTN